MIKVDPHFEGLLPELAPEELTLLEESIRAEGIRDPIVLWNDTIIDGHHRYRIAEKLGIDCRTRSMEFADQDEADIWVLTNQNARRNVTKAQQKTNRGKIYNLRKKKQGGDHGNQYTGKIDEPDRLEIVSGEKVPKVQNELLAKRTTAEVIAAELGTSAATIKREGKFVENLESIETVAPGFTREYESNKLKLTDEDASRLAGLDPDTRKDIAGKLMEGLVESIKEAIKNLENDTIADKRLQDIQKLKDAGRPDESFVNGDCLIELEKLPDNSIPCVVADPPYGINYIQNHRKIDSSICREIPNDTLPETLALLENTCEVLYRKMQDDSSLYMFTGWQHEPEFRSIIGKYFTVKNVIIWVKNNWGTGDLYHTYAPQYEQVIYAVKGNPPLYESRDPDVFYADKVPNKNIHSCEKPVDLIKVFIRHSTLPGEFVVDPFAGSGSTIEACKESGRRYWGCESDTEMYQRALGRLSGETPLDLFTSPEPERDASDSVLAESPNQTAAEYIKSIPKAKNRYESASNTAVTSKTDKRAETPFEQPENGLVDKPAESTQQNEKIYTSKDIKERLGIGIDWAGRLITQYFPAIKGKPKKLSANEFDTLIAGELIKKSHQTHESSPILNDLTGTGKFYQEAPEKHPETHDATSETIKTPVDFDTPTKSEQDTVLSDSAGVEEAPVNKLIRSDELARMVFPKHKKKKHKRKK